MKRSLGVLNGVPEAYFVKKKTLHFELTDCNARIIGISLKDTGLRYHRRRFARARPEKNSPHVRAENNRHSGKLVLVSIATARNYANREREREREIYSYRSRNRAT